MRCGAQLTDAPCGVLDDDQDVLALPGQCHGFQEVARQYRLGLAAPSWRCNTVTWWRNARISTSFSRSPIGSNRNTVNALLTTRWAKRTSTVDHPAGTATPTLGKSSQHRRPARRQKILSLSCVDDIVGTLGVSSCTG
jgi:hypothetical protein